MNEEDQCYDNSSQVRHLEGRVFERMYQFQELPPDIQQHVQRFVEILRRPDVHRDLFRVHHSSLLKLKQAVSVRGRELLDFIAKWLKHQKSGRERILNDQELQNLSNQIAEGLVLSGVLTPMKETNKINDPKSMPLVQENELLIPVASGLTEHKSTSVWDVVHGAIHAAWMKRKHGILKPFSSGQSVYVIVNKKTKCVHIFEDDIARGPLMEFAAHNLFVSFDDTEYEFGVKLWNNMDCEILNVNNAYLQNIFLNMLITIGCQYRETNDVTMITSFYELRDCDMSGREVLMSKFKDKVVLAVNVASESALAATQYPELCELDQKYRSQGLVILAFPCNQFGNEEPGSHPQILKYLEQYNCNFQVLEKRDVNGPRARSVFIYLKDKLPGTFGSFIKWNFTKFLIDRQGRPYKRYSPMHSPLSMEKDIQMLLSGEQHGEMGFQSPIQAATGIQGRGRQSRMKNTSDTNLNNQQMQENDPLQQNQGMTKGNQLTGNQHGLNTGKNMGNQDILLNENDKNFNRQGMHTSGTGLNRGNQELNVNDQNNLRNQGMDTTGTGLNRNNQGMHTSGTGLHQGLGEHTNLAKGGMHSPGRGLNSGMDNQHHLRNQNNQGVNSSETGLSQGLGERGLNTDRDYKRSVHGQGLNWNAGDNMNRNQQGMNTSMPGTDSLGSDYKVSERGMGQGSHGTGRSVGHQGLSMDKNDNNRHGQGMSSDISGTGLPSQTLSTSDRDNHSLKSKLLGHHHANTNLSNNTGVGQGSSNTGMGLGGQGVNDNQMHTSHQGLGNQFGHQQDPMINENTQGLSRHEHGIGSTIGDNNQHGTAKGAFSDSHPELTSIPEHNKHSGFSGMRSNQQPQTVEQIQDQWYDPQSNQSNLSERMTGKSKHKHHGSNQDEVLNPNSQFSNQGTGISNQFDNQRENQYSSDSSRNMNQTSNPLDFTNQSSGNTNENWRGHHTHHNDPKSLKEEEKWFEPQTEYPQTTTSQEQWYNPQTHTLENQPQRTHQHDLNPLHKLSHRSEDKHNKRTDEEQLPQHFETLHP